MAAGLALDSVALAVAGAALLGAFASGLSGFAFGLVTLGLWLHLLSPKIAGPLVVSASLIVQCFTLLRLRQALRVDLLWPFLVGGLIGAPVGVWLLDHAEPETFRRGMGIFLIIYAGWMLLAPPFRPVTAGGRAADGGVGFVGGVMGGLAGLSGAVPTAWCLLRGWGKDASRAIYQPFVTAIHVASLVVLAGAGLVTRDLGYYVAWSLPALALGAWLGFRVYLRVNEAQFRRVVLWLLLASGGSLVL